MHGSAALQEYAGLRVVLLIDDPPNPTDREQLDRLNRARELPRSLMHDLQEPRLRFEEALAAFDQDDDGRSNADASALRVVPFS